MSGNVTKLKPKQEDAIIALLSNRTVEDAARAVKIAPRTLYRWQQDPVFDAALLKARRAGYGRSIGRLQHASGIAVSVLLKVMGDPDTPASVKVRAVDSVLSHAAKAIEIEDILVRLAAIEQQSRIVEGALSCVEVM